MRVRRACPQPWLIPSDHDETIEVATGNGQKGTRGIGENTVEAGANQPHGVCLGPGGIVYIANRSNDRILKVLP
jgi:hypothetical protein